MSASIPYLKGFWGVIITLVTLWIAYQQLVTSSRTIRPSLVVSLVSATPDVVEAHGKLSHGFRLHNVGNTVARSVTLSIRTHQGGKTVHEDRGHDIGDLVIKEAAGYAVHVHGHEAKKNTEMIEEIEVVYGSDGGAWFWCSPRYSYNATFRYSFDYGRWLPHPHVKAAETETCE